MNNELTKSAIMQIIKFGFCMHRTITNYPCHECDFKPQCDNIYTNYKRGYSNRFGHIEYKREAVQYYLEHGGLKTDIVEYLI